MTAAIIDSTSPTAPSTLKTKVTPTPHLVKIPLRPSIRSASGSSTPSSTTSTLTSKHLSEGPVDSVIFRHGRVEDAPLMTEMQYSNYIYHYTEITAQKFRDSLDYPAMTAYHGKRMTPPVDEREVAYVVAERTSAETGETEVIGMSQVMTPNWERAYNHRWYESYSEKDFDCEVDTLYVKIGVQGGGIGRKLVLGALQEGYDRFNMRGSVIIWTLEQNTQGRNFYKRIGCSEVGMRTIDLAGIPHECVGYGFRTVAEGLGL
ncbi:hypothetical protein BGZ76_007418 [Entomortierella beljakovae]|nr:hypothetical protein BGZ76_007418 [Entomortierella beljakovae]